MYNHLSFHAWCISMMFYHWNEFYSILNHWQLSCLFSCLFGVIAKNVRPIMLVYMAGLLWGESLNSLGPSDAIWHWISWSTLVQVMAWCHQATSHYLNQCWLIISKVLWHSFEEIIIRTFEDTNKYSKFEDYIYKIQKWVKGPIMQKAFPCHDVIMVSWLIKGIKNGCPCIVEIRGTQGCALVGDPARAVGECRDVAKAQP